MYLFYFPFVDIIISLLTVIVNRFITFFRNIFIDFFLKLPYIKNTTRR
nr:MAG TPA: hypothetical protein [Bacteriophage sp.]